MSKLSTFLHPAVADETRDVVISKRFLDEQGNPIPFRIRAVTQEENDAITRKSTRQTKVGGQMVEKLDSTQFARRMAVAATVEPDFSSKELCDAYGTMDPLEVPGKMLLSGEFSRLLREIMALSGFDEDVEEQVKN